MGEPLEASNLRPNTNRPPKNEKFMPKGPLNQEIYVHTLKGHSRMRNLRQKDHSTEQFMSKHKQATHEWEIYAKGTT